MNRLTQPLLQNEAVWALIPQKQPIQMVDTLWYNDIKKTISGFTIKNSNIFCNNTVFTEPGIIENIAQTAALRAGYSFYNKAKLPNSSPPIGYIGAIKNLVIHQLPEIGEVLTTEVIEKQIVFDVILIEGRTFCNDQLIASCEMKIFSKKE